MTERPTPERPVVVLDQDECWELLGAEELGRLGYRLGDQVHVVPVNYGVHEGSLLVGTAAGNKLLAADLESEVGFEIDGFTDDDPAWSVLVRGRVHHLDEQRARMVADLVTGRRFLVQRD